MTHHLLRSLRVQWRSTPLAAQPAQQVAQVAQQVAQVAQQVAQVAQVAQQVAQVAQQVAQVVQTRTIPWQVCQGIERGLGRVTRRSR